jgi:hypothetical protein
MADLHVWVVERWVLKTERWLVVVAVGAQKAAKRALRISQVLSPRAHFRVRKYIPAEESPDA